MKLLRFKDNTYTWINSKLTSPILTEKEAIAYGVWQLKIKRDEVIMGIDNLKAYGITTKKDNIALYADDNGMFLYTMKLMGEENKTEEGNKNETNKSRI